MDLFFEDVDEYQEEQAERQIKIRVACDGMEQRAANYDVEGRQAALRVSSSSNSANHVITVVCNGKQTIKWLSLVVGQRLLGRRPRGARAGPGGRESPRYRSTAGAADRWVC